LAVIAPRTGTQGRRGGMRQQACCSRVDNRDLAMKIAGGRQGEPNLLRSRKVSADGSQGQLAVVGQACAAASCGTHARLNNPVGRSNPEEVWNQKENGAAPLVVQTEASRPEW